MSILFLYPLVGFALVFIMGMAGGLDDLDHKYGGREMSYICFGIIFFWPIIVLVFVLWVLWQGLRHIHKLVAVPQYFVGMFKFWAKLVAGKA